MPQVKIKEIIYTPTNVTEEPTGRDYDYLMQRWQGLTLPTTKQYVNLR